LSICWRAKAKGEEKLKASQHVAQRDLSPREKRNTNTIIDKYTTQSRGREWKTNMKKKYFSSLRLVRSRTHTLVLAVCAKHRGKELF
jgi:hypothetical protein